MPNVMCLCARCHFLEEDGGEESAEETQRFTENFSDVHPD